MTEQFLSSPPNDSDSLSLKWLNVRHIPDLLWQENPKLHDIGTIWESIAKSGFLDPAKFDKNLSNRAGSKGAFVYGNGRVEAVHWAWAEKQRGAAIEAPRGILEDEGGDWFIQVTVGLDAESEAAAADFGVFHNSSTMLGGDFADSDIWSMYDKQALAKVGKLIAEDSDFEPLAMTEEEMDSLLNFLNGGESSESGDGGESSGAAKSITCPHCGEEILVSD